jgi:hypothetical protein
VGSRDAGVVVVIQKEKPMVTPEKDVAVGGDGDGKDGDGVDNFGVGGGGFNRSCCCVLIAQILYRDQCILKGCNLGSTKPEFLGSKF